MKLYIAEKPSLGRAIAEVLPKPHQKGEGFIRLGNGDAVSWCIGHLLEQAEPDAYDPAFKKWQLDHLPIVPESWQLAPKPKTRKQLSVLRKLVKEADQLVHAGDPDREGQLLVDQVIDYLGVKGAKRDAVQRVLISDLNPSAVKRALESPRSNREFVPLATSALARSRADWLYGINLTRAYTLQGRKVGFNGLLSVGRVQTPVLGLVVRRDEEIEAFTSKPFYQVLAHLQTHPSSHQAPQCFSARWQPSEACEPYMDEEGRVLSKALAENVVQRINGKPGEVTEVSRKNKSQPPPLPYNLSALQIDAGKRFGMTAKQVLDTCQSLYERHKLVTYPRSDSRYLPREQLAQAPAVIEAIAANNPTLAAFSKHADTGLTSKAWNDAKVDAHHAIIPTLKASGADKLSKAEGQLYELIARQYLCQFFPRHEFTETRIEVTIEGGRFLAQAQQPTVMGWKQLFPSAPRAASNTDTHKREASAELNKEPKEWQQTLPMLKKGDCLQCERGELQERLTQPPRHFTDASLLAAMTGIARYVQDAAVRKILKDTDGLGTEATRAGILELLVKRGYIQRQGKQIRATDAGRGLIHSLPSAAALPDMTAQWESSLEAISQRQLRYGDFMAPMLTSLQGLVAESKANLPTALKGVASKGNSFKGRRSAGAKVGRGTGSKGQAPKGKGQKGSGLKGPGQKVAGGQGKGRTSGATKRRAKTSP